MILIPYSYNGTSLQSTDYEASFPGAQSDLQIRTNPSYVKRAGAPPVFAGKDFSPHVLNLEIKMVSNAGFMKQFESINQLFDTRDETPHQLICTDQEDSNKQYYVYATAKQVQGGHDGNMSVVTLALDDPIWQSVLSSTDTWSITSATDSTSITVNGNDNSYPVISITPTAVPTTDYIYNMWVQVVPTSPLPSPNRYLDITGSTDTTFDTAALVTAGKMQADGDDLRVFRDGVEVDRWLNGINTTDTHVIVVANLPSVARMVLHTALGSGDETEIELNNNAYNKGLISTLPNTGRLVIDSGLGSTNTEEFTYTAKTITSTKLAFTIGQRAVRGTSALAHFASEYVHFLPYDFNILYGNASETAPVTDDTRKPLEDLTSRNNSFIYTNFYDAAGTRPGAWLKFLRTVSSAKFSVSDFYTSTDDLGDTDPATALGMTAATYQALGTWRADTMALQWQKYFPDYVASVAVSGAQNQTSSSYPSIMGLRSLNKDGVITALWDLSPQASTDYGTWTDFSHPSSDATIPANTVNIRWAMVGTQLGSTDASTKIELSSVTVGVQYPPHVMLRTEDTNSQIDITISNDTTGDSMDIVYPVGVDQTMTIDTDPDFPNASYNSALVNGAVSLSSVRAAWLKLQPGANTLSFQNNLAASQNITIVINWQDRMNFF